MPFAIACAALMGFAIQRGGTCIVAAIDEVVSLGRWSRALALLEAALWVGGGLAVLHLVDVPTGPAPRYAADVAALAGGALLGLGAWTNRGCAFGTIARLGSGEWSYAAMPAGFYLGSRAAWRTFGRTPVMPATMQVAWLGSALTIVVAGLALWRGIGCMQAARRRRLLAHLWAPQRATIVIALASLALMLAAGAWTYSQWLVDLARGMAAMARPRSLLFAALFCGALLGGWTAGVALVRPNATAILRSLAGGFLMGVGGQLVPGGNDGLILVGLPNLHHSAILALAVMAATIAAAILLSRHAPRLGRRPRSA